MGGFSQGFIAAGYDVAGFDIERHQYGEQCYPGQLVIQDVLTLNGAQFKNAAVIVASPPCQSYSYLAMPWSRSKDPENSKAAKALRAKWETNGPDNRLFDACFRIQREAIAATCQCDCGPCSSGWHCECGHRHIPLIVENVRGAQPWVGRAKANYGSFYLWGDVEQIGNRIQVGPDIGKFGAGLRVIREQKRKGRNFHTYALTGGAVSSGSFNAGEHERRGVGLGTKTAGRVNKRDTSGTGTEYGGTFGWDGSAMRTGNSHSTARKAASAQIAKIPRPLSDYVARAVMPLVLRP